MHKRTRSHSQWSSIFTKGTHVLMALCTLQRLTCSLLSNFRGEKMLLFINYVSSIKSDADFRTLKIKYFWFEQKHQWFTSCCASLPFVLFFTWSRKGCYSLLSLKFMTTMCSWRMYLFIVEYPPSCSTEKVGCMLAYCWSTELCFCQAWCPEDAECENMAVVCS